MLKNQMYKYKYSVWWEVTVSRKYRIEEAEVSSLRLVRHGIKADKQRKLKLEISNA